MCKVTFWFSLLKILYAGSFVFVLFFFFASKNDPCSSFQDVAMSRLMYSGTRYTVNYQKPNFFKTFSP